MLDTNIVSAIMRDPAGVVAQRIAALATPVSISIIVAAELRSGAARKGSPQLTARVEEMLERIEVEPLSAPADVVYGLLRARLERVGQPMEGNDLLIAAHALSLDRVLVTADHAFERVPGLTTQNWLRN